MKHLRVVYTFLFCLLTYTVIAQQNSQPIQPEDDFAPGLAMFVLVAIAVMFICFLFCSVLAILFAILFFSLITMGIISTSILVGLQKRSLRKGFQVFLLMVSPLVGIPLSITILYVAKTGYDVDLSGSQILGIGFFSGLLGGLFFGQVLYLAIRRILDALTNRDDSAANASTINN